MRKIIGLLLALAVLLCAVPAMASETEVTLSLGIWPLDTDVRGLEVNNNVYLPAFQATHPNVKVVPAPYEYSMDTFIPLVESGNLPVLFSTYYTEPQKIISNGIAADITDALAARGWLEKISPAILGAVSDANGHVFGIPYSVYPLGLMINAELFEEAGLVDEAGLPIYPRTWDELCETAVKIKEETGSAGLCLLAMDNAGGWHFTNIAWTFGAEFEKLVDGKWTAALNSPEAVAALQLVKDMKWKYDILTADPTAENWGTGFQQLGTGVAAMYIAADDAVNQPTVNYGLDKDKLMMVGMPEGPAGSFTLMGGNLYMFSKDATPEQIEAGLDWIEVIGNAPVMTDTIKEGKIAGAKNNVELGVPVMKGLHLWEDDEYNAVGDAIYAEYVNVNPAMFAAFYEANTKAGALRGEEPVQTQDLYAELTKALQEILTNESADPQAVLDIAQANFQLLLDENVNK